MTQEPVDLASFSAPDRLEVALVVALVVLRALLLLRPRRRRLLPILDLPLLAVPIALTGGSLSPLDPTLPLVYLAALLFLRGAEGGRAPPKRVTFELLVGLAAIHLVVVRHDRSRLDAGATAEIERLRAFVANAREQSGAALATVADGLHAVPTDDANVAALAAELSSAQRSFERFVGSLAPDVAADQLADAKSALQSELDRRYDDYFKRRDEWRATRPPDAAARATLSLDLLRETQWSVRQDLLDRVDEIENALAERDQLRARQDSFLTSSIWRRAAIFGALLLFAGVAIVLRDRLAAAVRGAEERRARREIELAEQEKERWIALTAGLTHGLGNDILAYDVYLNELLATLEAAAPPAPKRVLDLLRFLADSNRGRLGFLQFLDAFARQRQAAAGDAPPLKLEPLALAPLLHRVRRNLAQVEIADLPAEGKDPAVDRQIRLLRDLPLEVHVADPSAGELAHGHRGIVEFFVYELLKNALRSSTGARPLIATLSRRDGALELELRNDVQIEEAAGRCPGCGAEGRLRRVRRRRDAPAACDRCFGRELETLLAASFAPGKGSGTGLGLFLIRHFLATFWKGEIRARVVDAAIPTVAFTVALPDPLAPHG